MAGAEFKRDGTVVPAAAFLHGSPGDGQASAGTHADARLGRQAFRPLLIVHCLKLDVIKIVS